jgi:hypothetical protein
MRPANGPGYLCSLLGVRFMNYGSGADGSYTTRDRYGLFSNRWKHPPYWHLSMLDSDRSCA